jgi:hypothetical protein
LVSRGHAILMQSSFTPSQSLPKASMSVSRVALPLLRFLSAVSCTCLVLHFVQDPAGPQSLDCKSIRVVKDGQVLWKVDADDAGTSMVFYVAGKPTLGLGVGPTACGVTLTSPDGALVQSLVVTNSGASHCIATSDVSAILASELRKSGDSWALRRSMEQGECQIDSKINHATAKSGATAGIELKSSGGGARCEMSPNGFKCTANINGMDTCVGEITIGRGLLLHVDREGKAISEWPVSLYK